MNLLNLSLRRRRNDKAWIFTSRERSDTGSFDNINTEIITRNNGRGVIIDEWEKLETIASFYYYKFNKVFSKSKKNSPIVPCLEQYH